MARLNWYMAVLPLSWSILTLSTPAVSKDSDRPPFFHPIEHSRYQKRCGVAPGGFLVGDPAASPFIRCCRRRSPQRLAYRDPRYVHRSQASRLVLAHRRPRDGDRAPGRAWGGPGAGEPRGSPRARARSARSGGPADGDPPAACSDPLRVRSHARVAPQRGARRRLGRWAAAELASNASISPGDGGRGERLGQGGVDRAAREHKALAERVRRRAGWRRAAPCRRPRRRHTARPRSSVRADRRRSRPSRSAPPAPPAPARAWDPGRPRAGPRRRWESARGRSLRMSSPTELAPVSRRRDWIARETSSRGASSSTKRSPVLASCSVAPSPRIASVTRNPSRPGTPITAVGWNCSSSRSASRAPAACASSSPTPCEPGGLVVRAHSAAAPPVASTTARADTTRAPPVLV